MAMQARDASGRKVSLLNDEPYASQYGGVQRRPSFGLATYSVSHASYLSASSRSASSSPHTPELLRSDSYDSQTSADPVSPLTPTSYDYPRTHAFAPGAAVYEEYEQAKRPSLAGSSRSNSYDEDAATSPLPDRPGKRYPCRYRDSHGCEKTFTTSGHASRHSKIHTAEKAVQCTFPGCSKKFTRADNMKQHLETHYKDKSRGSSTHKSASRPSLASISRRTTSSSGRSHSSRSAREHAAWEAEHYALPTSSTTPLPSPSVSATWDMRTLNLPLMSRPSAARTPSSGLDALAMAVAVQERG